MIISFSLSSLNSTNVDYESTFWMDKFVVLIDNQITNVSCFEVTTSLASLYCYISQIIMYIHVILISFLP